VGCTIGKGFKAEAPPLSGLLERLQTRQQQLRERWVAALAWERIKCIQRVGGGGVQGGGKLATRSAVMWCGAHARTVYTCWLDCWGCDTAPVPLLSALLC
jgi:hypothetical protein